MPTHCQWLDQAGNAVDRDLIDRECCELFDWPYSAYKFCPPFQHLELVAFSILLKAQTTDMNVKHPTPEMFDQWVIDNLDCWDPIIAKKLRGFFARYKFIIWYERY